MSILLVHSTFLLSNPDTSVTQNLNSFTLLQSDGSKIDIKERNSFGIPVALSLRRKFTSFRFNTSEVFVRDMA